MWGSTYVGEWAHLGRILAHFGCIEAEAYAQQLMGNAVTETRTMLGNVNDDDGDEVRRSSRHMGWIRSGFTN